MKMNLTPEELRVKYHMVPNTRVYESQTIFHPQEKFYFCYIFMSLKGNHKILCFWNYRKENLDKFPRFYCFPLYFR